MQKETDLILEVRVQPRASKDEIVGFQGERLKIRITAAPVEGQANRHLVRLLADVFGVPQRDIVLLSGENARNKRFRIVAPKQRPSFLSEMQ